MHLRARRLDHVEDEHQEREAEDQGAVGLEPVERLEAEPGRVGVHPPRHALEPDDMHRKEREVESDQHEPEVELAQALVQHVAEHLGPPVVGARHQREDAAAEHHVVEVRHHEVA